MKPPADRLPLLDAIKAVASQLIVLHHLSFYGPMSDRACPLAPELFMWLSRNGRMAVQVFLVISGFLAMRRLAPAGVIRLFRSPGSSIAHRYLRLVLPYAAMLVLSIACAALARQWMNDDSVPAAPTAGQILAHLLLLNGVLNIDSLSAGVWYVAIDFQLFALLVGCVWLAQRDGSLGPASRVLPALVLILGTASLFLFNRDAAWDDWAVYFFGAYALGALACWSSQPGRSAIWFAAMALICIGALSVDFRARIAVAGITAFVLFTACRTGLIVRWPHNTILAFMGRISYSVFLIHFPICLVANAFFSRFVAPDPAMNLFGVLLAWVASIAGGSVFYRCVESQSSQWLAWLHHVAQRLSPIHRGDAR